MGGRLRLWSCRGAGARTVHNTAVYDTVAKEYDQFYAGLPVTRFEDAYLQSLLARNLKPGYTVVDLGCGTGLGLELITRTRIPVRKYIGVDTSYDMLLQAANKRHNTTCEWKHADLGTPKAWPFQANAHADAVLSFFAAFNYVTDPTAFGDLLWNMMRLLRPGGYYLVVLYAAALSDRFPGYHIFDSLPAARHPVKMSFTVKAVRRLFGNCGKLRVRGLSRLTYRHPNRLAWWLDRALAGVCADKYNCLVVEGWT